MHKFNKIAIWVPGSGRRGDLAMTALAIANFS
jgi:hypothetical protein